MENEEEKKRKCNGKSECCQKELSNDKECCGKCHEEEEEIMLSLLMNFFKSTSAKK
jgi:hypothetical protein